jgi:DNA-binding FadR family transcriptional regulator
MSKSTSISTTKSGSKHNQVVSDLGRRIVLGIYPVDSVLPSEAELLAEFGVSRPVFREAIKSLESKGMLESRQQRGISVRPRDRWNFLDMDVLNWIVHSRADPEMLLRLTEVRMIVEPGACALAAALGTEFGLSRIEEAWRRMEACVDDPELYVEADRDFHIAILMASGNEYLAAVGTVISVALRASVERTNPSSANNRNSLPAHYRILEALRRRNGVRAARESRRQLQEAWNLLQSGKTVSKEWVAPALPRQRRRTSNTAR